MRVFLFITSVRVPSSAAAGTIVDVEVTVGNPGPTVFTYAAVTGVYNAVEFAFSPAYHELPPDASKEFVGQFVMPSKDVSITVYAFYWANNRWNLDDEQTVTVKLGEGAPSGRITRKYIKHDGSALQGIPAGDIPLNDSTQIHVYCEHDHPSTKKLKVEWVVKDPDGHVADRYDAEDNVASQSEKHFYDYFGPRLSKAGIYTIDINFYVEGTLVDSYSGTLCTVPGGAIGDGEIISKVLRHGGIFLEHADYIPAFGIEVGKLFQLEIGFKNTGTVSMRFGLHWIIEKPSGMQIEATATELIGTNPGATETFLEPTIDAYHVDEEGLWKLKKLELLGETGAVLDSWDGDLFTSVEVAAGDGEFISKAILHGKGMVPTETAAIPASNIEKGERFKLKIGFKNTGTTSMRFGLHWVIEKPGGDTIEGTATELVPTSAGATETFLEPTAIPYLIDEKGTWRLTTLELLDENENVLDTWTGVLLTAIGEEPPDDGEGIIELKIVHGTGLLVGEEKDPPVSGVVTSDWFKVKVTGVNPATSALQMGLHYIITKPDSSTIEDTVKEVWPYTGGGKAHTFYEPGVDALTIDQVGGWFLSVELLGGDSILDAWEGAIFSAEAAPPSITDMIPMLMMVMMMGIMVPMMEGV